MISADNSFHGRTLATLTATGQPEKQAAVPPACPRGSSTCPTTTWPRSTRRSTPDTVAAVLLEPLQGEGGVMVPSSDYLGAVRALCTERNALLMLDEVQTGLGRTGHWFAFQAQGLEPDVVTMAKALGNGMPVGACWARAEVAAAFGPGDHGSTFGGQPLALAAAKATLAVMEAEDVCGRAPAQGGAPGGRAGRAARRRVGARGRSAAGGPTRARRWPRRSRRAALGRGLLVNPVRPDAVRVAPPLLVSDDEIDAALAILGRGAWPRSLAGTDGRRGEGS